MFTKPRKGALRYLWDFELKREKRNRQMRNLPISLKIAESDAFELGVVEGGSTVNTKMVAF
jgi:hypothetical protein